MPVEIVNWVIAIATFGALGWAIGLRRSTPAGPLVYALLLVGAILGLFIGRSTVLIGVDEFGLYANRALFSICVGVGIGSVSQVLKLRRLRNE